MPFVVDDALYIGAMLAGTALANKAQTDALKKQREIQVGNQRMLSQQRDAATDVALRKALEFQGEDRQARQDEIAKALEADFKPAVEGTPITAQGVQVGSTIPTAGATSDYLAATAREKAKTTDSLRSLAQLMGRIGSAGQLRRDEAVGIGDAAGQIGRIQNNAGNMAEIENIRANSVTPSLGLQLAGSALSAWGGGKLASSGVGGTAQRGLAKVAPGSSYANPNLMSLSGLPWN
ncbi:MAG: hypothetical protein KF871_10930 [Hydrogenophaga sp.]|uniref:hypothetical protein n=1 Tax=Hydrogenophaga sp. TaxID=1904254 RepID=UPI001DB94FD6|nr:hypothetical protein [Hydrogenophaga sp.]MBX3610396.1 hypothetical protein [Hydrogenophaga sp.]